MNEYELKLAAALAGYDAQYGVQSIGQRYPELPAGCVQRVEAVVNAAREIVRVAQAEDEEWWESVKEHWTEYFEDSGEDSPSESTQDA